MYCMCTNQKTLVSSWYELGLGDLCFQPLIQLHCLITSYNFQTNSPLDKMDLFRLIIALHGLLSRLRIKCRVLYQTIIFCWIQQPSWWWSAYQCNIYISDLEKNAPYSPDNISNNDEVDNYWYITRVPWCIESWNTTCTTFIFSDDVLQMLIRYSYDILTPSYPF